MNLIDDDTSTLVSMSVITKCYKVLQHWVSSQLSLYGTYKYRARDRAFWWRSKSQPQRQANPHSEQVIVPHTTTPSTPSISVKSKQVQKSEIL